MLMSSYIRVHIEIHLIDDVMPNNKLAAAAAAIDLTHTLCTHTCSTRAATQRISISESQEQHVKKKSVYQYVQ